MAWVKSEYAGEFAVLATWLVGLAPWSVSLFEIEGVTVIGFRFLPFRFQFIFGATLPGERPFLWAWQVAGFQGSAPLALAGTLGFAAFATFLLPLGLSLYYYVAEDHMDATLPIDPVRLFGGLLGLVGVLTLAASGLFITSFPGITVPVGALVALVFAYLLLTIDRA
ncbi:TIGR04206 family protein [Haloarcula sp. S1AR25-5A]|uniref:TIGR04206 family protein n=1 Tax=Haloarcula terrestris TaxID=2950533 RepID=A0AAE4JGB4_9EURY|nr:TIGR04206 family protein [Haloarcula terrestris]MDS0221197.1 TIGR04206 family protein [Haloarcula terrestris]